MTEREKAYVAGVIDGEGSVSIEKRAGGKTYPVYKVTVCIANTDLRLLVWLRARIAGSSIVPKAVPPPDKDWSQPYQLQLHSDDASSLLIAVRDDLVSKQAQADLAIAFHSTRIGRGGTYTADQREMREHFYQEARRLNRRGRGRYDHAERLSETGPHVVVRNIQ